MMTTMTWLKDYSFWKNKRTTQAILANLRIKAIETKK